MINFVADYTIENTRPSTISELVEWIKEQKYIVIDTETKNLGEPKTFHIHQQRVTMLQIGNRFEQWAMDVRAIKHEDYEDLKQLQKLLLSRKLIKIGHNIKYDYQVLDNMGISVDHVYDTMLGEHIRYTGLHQEKGFYSLEETLARYTGLRPYGNQLELFKPWIPKKLRNEIGAMDKFDLAAVTYGCQDIISTDLVYQLQLKYLTENNLLRVSKLENKFVLVLADMELAGMPLNVDRWLELEEWTEGKISIALQMLQEQYPEIENWNSHVQVKKLFKSLGINVSTQDGKDSVQELVIKEQEKDYPIIGDYLKYKGFSKLKSTYGAKFLKYLSPDRIHSNFVQILSTGRTSSTSPNMQNIVSYKDDFKEGIWWREAFEAPEGRTLIVADYSSQELATVAHISKDKVMIEALTNKQDLHRIAAAALYNIREDQVTKEQRQNGKIFNFAVLYGASANKIAQQFKISTKEAQKLIDNYFSKFSGLKEFQEKTFKKALAQGYINVDKLGRRSYLFDYNIYQFNKSKKLYNEYFRLNANYQIQGTAASMSKYAGVLLRNSLKGTSAKICLLVHDEYVIECDIHEAEKVKLLVERAMYKSSQIFCGGLSRAEAVITRNWVK